MRIIKRRLSPHLARDSCDCQDWLSSSTRSQQDRTRQEDIPSATSKKSVRFSDDPTFAADSSSSYDLSDETTKQQLWWSQDELQETTDEWKHAVHKFRADQQNEDSTSHTSLDKKMGALYKQCSTWNVPQVLRCKANQELLQEMRMADVRGLENKLSGMATAYRKHHVQSILSTTTTGNHINDEQDVDEALCTRSVQTSRASQVLARVLAQLDAKECL